jgi:serine/threonine-protein kinase
LPNDPRIFELRSYVDRRQGKQDEALRNLERAADLDPRNVITLQQIGVSYELFRCYADAKLLWDRVLAIKPDDAETKGELALMEFDWKADTRLLHQTIDSIRATDPAAVPNVADVWLICALAERDAPAAENALIAAGKIPWDDDVVQLNPPFILGVIARMAGDDDKATSAFIAARAEQEKTVEVEQNYAPPLCALGLIDAALGRKEEALREGRRAVELLPMEKDAINGVAMVKYLAMIAAWVGDKDLACQQLALAIRPPSRLTYGQLTLLPFWDPLRGDPRFEKTVASLAPKEN